MSLGINLNIGGLRTVGASASFSISITGLTDGDAQPGSTISYTITPDNGTETVAWGTVAGDDSYGTGANPTGFTMGNLVLTVTDGGEEVSRSAPIRYAAGTASSIADGQSWTVDDTSVNLSGAAVGTGLTWSYAATGLPAGLGISSSTGLITGTPTAVDSGTITITATDQYGRTVEDTFTFTAALRSQATGGADLNLAFEVNSAITSTNLIANWSANGNTISYAITGTALPTGLSVSSAGAMTGTPTVETADATYTLRGTDEYGRITDDTFTLEIPAVSDPLELSPNVGNPFTSTENITGFGATLALDAGDLIVTAEDGSTDRAEWDFGGLTIGATYDIEIIAQETVGVTGSIRAFVGFNVPTTSLTTSMDTYTFSLEATAETAKIRVYAATSGSIGDQIRVEKVSIKAAAVDSTAPVISSFTWVDTATGGSFTSSEAGTVHLATYSGTAPTPDGSGGWTGTTLEEFSDTIVVAANTFNVAETAASATATNFACYTRDAAGNDSTVVTQAYTSAFAASGHDFTETFDGAASTTFASLTGWDAASGAGWTIDGAGNGTTPIGGGIAWARTTATYATPTITMEGVSWNGPQDVACHFLAHIAMSTDEASGYAVGLEHSSGAFTMSINAGLYAPVSNVTEAAIFALTGINISTDTFDFRVIEVDAGGGLSTISIEVFSTGAAWVEVLSASSQVTPTAGPAGVSTYSEGDATRFWEFDTFNVDAA